MTLSTVRTAVAPSGAPMGEMAMLMLSTVIVRRTGRRVVLIGQATAVLWCRSRTDNTRAIPEGRGDGRRGLCRVGPGGA
ncbi:hypothetical protein [Streptomyces noursei]|uniref:Uncharacterized protein n=1 Tax=Streptomyces noursei TaxID=1971 RepID=A0A2N8PBU6_STRNR|nr:hypothetical protein [Streptomyces noursei]PNE38499.1 hypothetical protein AOB60_31275 [Streptomyces noursei]